MEAVTFQALDALVTGYLWDDYDTLGGLLIAMLDRIPSPKEHPSVEVGGVRFTVQRSNSRQILEVLAERVQAEAAPEQET